MTPGAYHNMVVNESLSMVSEALERLSRTRACTPDDLTAIVKGATLGRIQALADYGYDPPHGVPDPATLLSADTAATGERSTVCCPSPSASSLDAYPLAPTAEALEDGVAALRRYTAAQSCIPAGCYALAALVQRGAASARSDVSRSSSSAAIARLGSAASARLDDAPVDLEVQRPQQPSGAGGRSCYV